MRLVLDTNVVVSGLIWSGPPRTLLDLARRGRVVLFSSGVLLDELASVLERDKFAAFLAARDVTPAFLMRRYGMLATLVKPTRVTRAVPADPDDDHVVAAASSAASIQSSRRRPRVRLPRNPRPACRPRIGGTPLDWRLPSCMPCSGSCPRLERLCRRSASN